MTSSTFHVLFKYAKFILKYVKNHTPIVKIKFFDPQTPNPYIEIGTEGGPLLREFNRKNPKVLQKAIPGKTNSLIKWLENLKT